MTRPPTRLTDTPEIPPPHVVRVNTARVVTTEQVDRAVLQLRERRGQTAVEQVQAVLRALDLSVQDSLAAATGGRGSSGAHPASGSGSARC